MEGGRTRARIRNAEFAYIPSSDRLKCCVNCSANWSDIEQQQEKAQLARTHGVRRIGRQR